MIKFLWKQFISLMRSEVGGLIVKPNTFSAGGTIVAAEHNSNYDTVFNEFNGSISNVNIDSSAAIALSKVDLTSTATFTNTITFRNIIVTTAVADNVTSIVVNQNDTTNDPPAISAIQAGWGPCYKATANDTGPHWNLSGDPTNPAPKDGDFWFTGSALNFYDGTNTSDLLTVVSGNTIQHIYSTLSTTVNVVATLPDLTTPPLYSEGTQIAQISITPKDALNKIRIQADFYGHGEGGTDYYWWINDATGSDEAVTIRGGNTNEGKVQASIDFTVVAGSTSTRTYYLMGGTSGATTWYIGGGDNGAQIFGGSVPFGSITATEIRTS